MEKLSHKQKTDKLLTLILVAFTLVSFYCRIFYGWDHDESYNILLAQRIADGKILFKDMWDLHQTAAIFPAVFCKVYTAFAGSTDGIAIFLRIMSVLFQVIVAFYTYVVIKRFYGDRCAFCAAVVTANLLPRATQETEYSTVAVWGCLICGLLLFQEKRLGRKNTRLIIAAVCYAAAVYSYPTLVITAPFMALLIIFCVYGDRKQGVAGALIFLFTCALLAGVLFAYLFSHMSINEFAGIIGELGKNDDHIVYFRGLWPVFAYKSVIRIVVTIAAAVLIRLLLKTLFKVEVRAVYLYILLTTLFVVVLNVSGLRPSGPFGLLERYLGAIILGLFIGISHEDRDFAWILGGTGVFIYLGVIMGSNLGLNENAMFLEMSILCLVVLCIKKLETMNVNEYFLSKLGVFIFILGIIFTSGYFVRIDGTGPANVFQCSSTITKGPLKGISVFPEQKERYDALSSSVESITEAGKSYTLLTNDAIMYYFVEGDYISPQYAATGQYYNEQWVDFFTLFDRDMPDEILVNKFNYPDMSVISDTDFLKWVYTEYKFNTQKSDDCFWVFARSTE